MSQNTESRNKMHWIYVLGAAEFRAAAHRWRQRKHDAGKCYEVIEGARDENPAGRLGHLLPDDVLYVYAPMSAELPRTLGETGKKPQELAALLCAEGLPPGHRVLKIFASHSGDAFAADGDLASYAERLYHAMKAGYPHLLVHGYHGAVSPEGFASHKTAGLGAGEAPVDLDEGDWNTRGLRAKANRVRFPA